MTPDYWMAAAGGLTIGLSAVILLASLGRIAGICGILWAAASLQPALNWRLLFLLGLLAGGWGAHALTAVPIPAASGLPTPAAIAAGLLVGIGVRLANGCTSGHGVCGLGLRSLRSVVATLTFMSCGVMTVAAVRHLAGVGV